MTRILALSLFATSAQASEVLIYNDTGYSYSDTAAIGLGHVAHTWQSDGAGFGADWAGGFGDLVIIEAPYNYLPSQGLDVLRQALAAGVPVIVSYWQLDGDPTLQAILGVGSAGDYYTPESVLRGSDPYGFFAGAPDLTPTGDPTNDDGDYLTGGTPAYYLSSGNVGITLSMGGLAITNGWAPIIFGGADNDFDGTEDVVEVLRNQITAALSGGGPTIALGGSCPSAVTISATGFTPGGNVAVVRSSGLGSFAIPSGGCAGTMLGLSPSGVGLATVVTASGSGSISYSGSVGAALCTKTFQFVDLSTCTPSNTDTF